VARDCAAAGTFPSAVLRCAAGRTFPSPVVINAPRVSLRSCCPVRSASRSSHQIILRSGTNSRCVGAFVISVWHHQHVKPRVRDKGRRDLGQVDLGEPLNRNDAVTDERLWTLSYFRFL
jgi:hypothetical protein